MLLRPLLGLTFAAACAILLLSHPSAHAEHTGAAAKPFTALRMRRSMMLPNHNMGHHIHKLSPPTSSSSSSSSSSSWLSLSPSLRGGVTVNSAVVDPVETTEDLMQTMLRPEDKDGLRQRFAANIRRAQLEICRAIEELDGGAKFKEDAWDREGGGGGRTRVLAKGNVFEKAGVALSVVYGQMPLKAISVATEDPEIIARAKELAGSTETLPFFVASISSVMHPRNPFAPTMHFNYRFFDFDNSDDNGLWWFGGGTDLTPSYLNEDDIKHFHGSYKDVCDKHDPTYYEKYKKWADRYFQIKHRGETRGVGGIFFDDKNDKDPEEIFKFSKDCLDNVVKAYVPIVAKHKDDDFTQKQKDWQQMRRGRYVEFNLVYDRGTTFGLRTGGRVESILMSLPETARWEYNHQVEEGSPEAEILDVFKNPRDWV
uniref:coproporphyrinogen oxidase n=1 Tax=Lotharella oceanica TaxID=641309 RepID=A0A7S2U5M9_9EUKA|mmetsp:Transcript_9175/g.17841  ORF Transcript_9175/g.17841 Transcript_9175/m.17841 type:complete len:427 (+) Transcript_9175:39-1319(+)